MGVGARDEPKGLTPDGDVLAALRSKIHQSHRLLDERVSAAAKRTRVAPAAHSEVLSLYVHALCVEDTTVNVLLRGKPPLFSSTWSGGHLQPWDLTTLRGYAEAVYATTDALLCQLAPSDLQTAIDLSHAGLGRRDLGWVLNHFVLSETVTLCGELAARRVATRRASGPQRAVASRRGRLNGESPRSHAAT